MAVLVAINVLVRDGLADALVVGERKNDFVTVAVLVIINVLVPDDIPVLDPVAFPEEVEQDVGERRKDFVSEALDVAEPVGIGMTVLVRDDLVDDDVLGERNNVLVPEAVRVGMNVLVPEAIPVLDNVALPE